MQNNPKKKNKGLFIVLYGTNRVGKTTQAINLLERINKAGRLIAQYLKFPNYTLLPTGPRINDYLRKGNPERLTPEKFQELCTQNRRDAEPRIKEMLENGSMVIAEDWTYGGIVWGIATGVPEKRAREMNKDFLKEDIPILLDGKPFVEGKENGHAHEEKNKLLYDVRRQYLTIASEEGWSLVLANRPVEDVHRDIWDIVKPELP
ncbi:MAG: hypothetical protein HYT28_03200 [Parcubacteria group bacterium]|nr:hypothetical protein [Parcubacteria group bacterium]